MTQAGLSFVVITVCLGAWISCAASVPCSTGADCGDRQCCVDVKNGVTVVGRREVVDASHPGVCVNMGGVAAQCHVKAGYAWQKPAGLVKLCPCRTGLICGPVDRHDQFGQRGYCSFG